MNEIIKVNNESMTVSARDLHDALEVKTAFKDWFPRMCEYGFSLGTDYSVKALESTGGRQAMDADITIDMAKEICMIQKTEKGRLVRNYFIQLDNQIAHLDDSEASNAIVYKRALQMATTELNHGPNHWRSVQSMATIQDILTIQSEKKEPSRKVVYVIEFDDGTIKIGISKEPKKRFIAIQCASGRTIRRVFISPMITEFASAENKAHKQFKKYRAKGEFFIGTDFEDCVSYVENMTGKGQQYFINKFLQG